MSSDYRSFDDLPLTLRVEDLMPILGIGRNTAYELVRSGKSAAFGSAVSCGFQKTRWSRIFPAETADFIK